MWTQKIIENIKKYYICTYIATERIQNKIKYFQKKFLILLNTLTCFAKAEKKI